MIEVACICKWRFEVQDEHAGRSIKCPKCRRLVEVPVAPPSPPSPMVEAGTVGEPEEPRPQAGLATSAELEALCASIDRLAPLGRSINTRLGWIIAILALLLIRVLLPR